MRLLHRIGDGVYKLTNEYVKEEDKPKYATLSHTWLAETEEVTFEDMRLGVGQRKASGYEKIRFCGEQAAKDGLEYFWVDTCCIDRSSSQNVQEAISSMFQWYRKATKCYAYLRDVCISQSDSDDSLVSRSCENALRNSRWFTRGWTLQELLAPSSVEFFSVDGTRLGDKKSLQGCIHEVTGIPFQALEGESLGNFTVEERMLWAEKRQTTRPEDKAYSLLGIFDVFMPLIYGEGDKHAFARLHEEIYKKHSERVRSDDSLLDTLPMSPSAAFNSLENEHGSTCLPNTRVELLQDITDWADGSDDRCIYWLDGLAGTGKSTIARTIARHFYDRGNLGGSFFFSRRSGDASHAGRLFTTLASQLARRIPATKRYICDAITQHKDIPKDALRDQWQELIIKPLSKIQSEAHCPSIVMVLDALDECDNERHIGIILRLWATTKRLKNVRLRIFITSRPETAVRCGFQQIPEAERQVFVLHDIESTVIDRDLTLFFEHGLSTIREERGFRQTWPGKEAVARLVESSCGLFVWASIAISYIRKGRHFAMNRITRLIKGHRSGAGPLKQLDSIYITVLNESIRPGYDDEEKAELFERLRKILGSIVVIFVPLSIDSLAILLETESDLIRESLADLHTICNIPAANDGPIRLHHPTFRDFLLDKDRCSDLDFWIDGKEAHARLVRCCLRLMRKKLRQDLCDLQSPGVQATDVEQIRIHSALPPELQYACLYWAEHCLQSGTSLRDDDDAHQFLQEHFLHWFEAISLMRRCGEMAGIVKLYRSLLVPANNASQVPFVNNARQFMCAFQSQIEKAPLQVYCAALVFCRRSNQLRHHFWRQLHPWLKRVRIAEADAPEVKEEYNYVNDLAFTPDGRELASGSIGEYARVWNVASKVALWRCEGQTDKVSSVAISPDGSVLASGSDDSTVMICDLKSRQVRCMLVGHARWVNSVEFSPDGKLLASGSMDESMRIWDVESGEQLEIFEPSFSEIISLAFSPDGTCIALGTAGHSIPIWDLKNKKIRLMLDGHWAHVNSVRFSPSGKRIVSGSDDTTVRLWDAVVGIEIRALRGHLQRVRAVAFSNDESMIASGSEDKTIKLWDVDTGELYFTLTGHTSGLNAVAFSPNDELLASGAFNDEVRLWDARTGQPNGLLADFQQRGNAARPLIGKFVAPLMGRLRSGSLEYYGNTIGPQKGHKDSVTCLMPSPDRSIVVSGSLDNTVRVWTKEGIERFKSSAHSGGINHLSFSSNGQVFASASADRTARLWNTETGKLLHTFSGHPGAVRLTRFSPNNLLLATCSTDQIIRIWDVTKGLPLGKLKGHLDAVNDVAFSPDNKLLASCSTDMTICIWDSQSSAHAIKTVNAHEASINSIAFSSDGQFLVSSSSDKTVRIWDLNRMGCHTLEGHTLPVTSAAFSNDMRKIVSGSEDGTIRIWDLETQSELMKMKVGVIIRKASFSTCGRYIDTERGMLPIGDDVSGLQNLLFVGEEWVKCDMEDCLWLPEDHRAESVATCGRTVALGHESGAISFIGV